MYNLHCHTLLSDGVLLPSEIAVRFAAAGYKVLAITDHCDYSNIKSTVASILEFTVHWPKKFPLAVLPGIELTHIPPGQFKPLAAYARKQGIKIIIGHGETPVEPVVEGTNRAALEADIDILAHPGLITDKDVLLAKKKGIFLELTARRGHRDTNGHVAERALVLGAPLVINIDAHAPEDIISPEGLIKVGVRAGLSQKEIDKVFANLRMFLKGKGL